MSKKVAIMQPYFFPYIGYFQLICESDIFVIYNDVNFIERGYSNRNNFLVNKEAKLLSLPLKKASSSKLYNETEVDYGSKQFLKFINTIKQSYSKAPFFKEAFSLLESCLDESEAKTLDLLCKRSFELIWDYLGLNTSFLLSSDIDYNKDASRVGKVNDIASILDSTDLLFPTGSAELYSSSDFPNYRSTIIEPGVISYNQGMRNFVKSLSFLDILMFNSDENVRIILKDNIKRELNAS